MLSAESGFFILPGNREASQNPLHWHHPIYRRPRLRTGLHPSYGFISIISNRKPTSENHIKASVAKKTMHLQCQGVSGLSPPNPHFLCDFFPPSTIPTKSSSPWPWTPPLAVKTNGTTGWGSRCRCRTNSWCWDDGRKGFSSTRWFTGCRRAARSCTQRSLRRASMEKGEG